MLNEKPQLTNVNNIFPKNLRNIVFGLSTSKEEGEFDEDEEEEM
jgi:hypothetical protein